MHIMTKQVDPSKGPQSATYSTRWEDLHSDSQKFLLQLEERILESKGECARLNSAEGIQESSSTQAHHQFQQDSARISQVLKNLTAAIREESGTSGRLLNEARRVLHQAIVAVRSLHLIRQQFLGSSSISTSALQAAGVSNRMALGDIYRGVPVFPSPFLEETVARLDSSVSDSILKIEELERYLRPPSNSATWGRSERERREEEGGDSLHQQLPAVMSNVHTFLIHVTAKMEKVHEEIQIAKSAFLSSRQRLGISSNPFSEAENREKKHKSHLSSSLSSSSSSSSPPLIHPSLLPSPLLSAAQAPSPQPTLFATSTPTGGLFSSFSSSPAPSLFGTPSLTPSSTPSLFGTPSQAPSSTPSLFGSSTFGSSFTTPSLPSSQPSFGFSQPSSAPSLFGTPSASPFGQASSPAPSLFGTPPSSSPSLFGAPPASSPSIFSTPSSTPSGGLFGASASTPSIFGGGAFGAQTSTPGAPSFTPPPPLIIPGGGNASTNPSTTAFGFGTSSNTVTKSKSRSGRRK